MIEGVRLHGGDVVRHLGRVRIKELLQCPDAGSYDIEQQALDGDAAETFIEVFTGAEAIELRNIPRCIIGSTMLKGDVED